MHQFLSVTNNTSNSYVWIAVYLPLVKLQMIHWELSHSESIAHMWLFIIIQLYLKRSCLPSLFKKKLLFERGKELSFPSKLSSICIADVQVWCDWLNYPVLLPDIQHTKANKCLHSQASQVSFNLKGQFTINWYLVPLNCYAIYLYIISGTLGGKIINIYQSHVKQVILWFQLSQREM